MLKHHPPPPKLNGEHPREPAVEEKIDRIIQILDRMNRRDRWRTVGGFFRSLIGMIPLIFFLGSLWYLYAYSDVLLQRITHEAAKQAAALTGQSVDSILKQLPSGNLGDLLHLLR